MKLYEKAKTRSLVDVARMSGFTLREQGAGYAAKHCPHCDPGSNYAMSIFPKDGIWRWNCFRCNRGGTVIDFAAAVWAVSEKEAAMKLANNEELEKTAATPAPEKKKASTPALEKAFRDILMHGHTSVKECIDYLKSREISEATIQAAVRNGMLRFLPANAFYANRMLNEKVGIGTLREAGLLKEGSKWPAISFRPMVFFFPGGGAAEFRIAREANEDEPKAIRYGTVKWPWWWKQGNKVGRIYVVEGVIDLLSRVELGLKEGEAVLGIPGANAWQAEWFAAARKTHPEAEFVLALDADETGREVVFQLHEVLDEMGLPVSEQVPSKGKDWNEYLQAVRASAKLKIVA